MLISFNFSNFCSFGNETEFTMSVGSTKRHISHIGKVNGVNVLKYSAIYGANAAGKTSLVNAIKRSKEMIQGMPVYRCHGSNCRCIPDNNSKPTSFEYFFETEGRFFQYGFTTVLANMEFDSEWLYELTPDMGGETLIYSINRDENGVVPDWSYFTDERDRIRLDYILQDSNEDEDSPDIISKYDKLFISKIKGKDFKNTPDLEVLRIVYRWFAFKLLVNRLKSPEDDDGFQKVCSYLSRYDTDIVGGEYRFESDVTDRLPDDFKTYAREGKPMINRDNNSKIVLENGRMNLYILHTKHGSTDADFKIDEESRGSRNAVNLIYSLFCSDSTDITYIFDEFGAAMHPLLVSKILADYQDHNVTSMNQLIVATHHTSIMSYDFFRRDEMWFIEKECGLSRLYSLENFEERSDVEISKRYLEGRYGALPVFTQEYNIGEGY